MKKQTILVFGLFLVYLLIVLQILPITYAINDDVAMRDIASGATTGTPDFHLIFVKAAWGMVLSTIYKWFSGIDWYGLIWMGLIIFSMCLVLWRMGLFCEKKEKNPILMTIGFLALATLVGLEHLVSFQFTVVAGIVIGAAIFFYFTSEGTDKGLYIEAVIVIMMIWISYCIRTNVLLMAVPFGGLVFLYKKDSIRKKIVMLIIVVLGLAVITGIEHRAYNGNDWKAYKEYNNYRSMVYDYYNVPGYEEHKEFYDKIGLKEHDVANLERYNLYFVDNVETEKMQQIAEYAREVYYQQNSLWTRIKAGIKCAVLGELERENLYLNLLAKVIILLNLVLGFKERKKDFWINIAFLLCEGLIMLYLGFKGRLPARVGASLFFIELFSAYSIFYKEHMATVSICNTKNWIKRIVIIFVVILAGNHFINIHERQETTYNHNLQYEEFIRFCSNNFEKIYFVPVQFTASYSENFKVQRESKVTNELSLGGWTCFSPVENQKLAYFEINNADRAIIEKENVHIILTHSSSKIEKHYLEKYAKVMWENVGVAPIWGMDVQVLKINAQ